MCNGNKRKIRICRVYNGQQKIDIISDLMIIFK